MNQRTAEAAAREIFVDCVGTTRGCWEERITGALLDFHHVGLRDGMEKIAQRYERSGQRLHAEMIRGEAAAILAEAQP